VCRAVQPRFAQVGISVGMGDRRPLIHPARQFDRRFVDLKEISFDLIQILDTPAKVHFGPRIHFEPIFRVLEPLYQRRMVDEIAIDHGFDIGLIVSGESKQFRDYDIQSIRYRGRREDR
jgi:hypothetical protein